MNYNLKILVQYKIFKKTISAKIYFFINLVFYFILFF